MVILFSGIPGCGKTTIVRLIAMRLRKLGSLRIFISDKLRSPVYQKFFKLLRVHAGRYDFLIFDATFYKKKWRDEMRRIAKKERVFIVYLDCSLRTALERNKKRRAGIPEKAVYIVFHQFEKPKRPDIIIDTEKTGADDAALHIFKMIKRHAV